MQRLALQRDSALLALLAACSAVFLTALDQTVVVTALPSIIADLQISTTQLDRAAWIITGYLLGYLIAMPLMGRISDIYGRRRVFLICLGIFGFGSLFCGLAPILGDNIDISFLQHIGINVAAPGDFSDPNMLTPGLVWLVAARFVQAAGGGAIIPIAMAVAGDYYGEKQRSLALGLIGMVTETGGVLGPLYGSVIVQNWGWQAIFYINLPIVFVLMIAIWLFVPAGTYRVGVGGVADGEPSAVAEGGASSPAPTGAARVGRGRVRIDWLGALLLGASLICLSLGLSQEAITSTTGITGTASNQAPIENNPVLIGIALLLLAIFIVLEVMIERRNLPLIELSLFKRATFSASSLVSLLVGAALIIAMVDIPLFVATVLGGGPIDSGLALLRLTVMIPIGAIIGGWLCGRITCRLTAIVGLIPAALGFWLMHLWPANVGWLQITTSTVICGLGFGLVIAPISTTAINAANKRQMGMASSTVTVLRMVGMILGLAALTSWGLGKFHDLLVAFRPPPGTTVLSPAYTTAYLKYVTFAAHEVFTSIFLAAGIVCLIAIVPAFLMEGRKSSPYELIRRG
ncbi:MAG TPA: MFS transporter [Ktedonobacteraceae bacterium]|nr:MFS transporter [Ktedonobacteraceae bacterium]